MPANLVPKTKDHMNKKTDRKLNKEAYRMLSLRMTKYLILRRASTFIRPMESRKQKKYPYNKFLQKFL